MDPMRAFLTEENIMIHKEYMRTLRLRHSILEKSVPQIKGKSVFEIEKMRLNSSIKDDALPNLREYLAHEIYFNSFENARHSSPAVKDYYSSYEAFLYEIYLVAMNESCGFVFVFIDERGRPIICHNNANKRVKFMPKIAIDISEHAYFLDYRFDKERYLRSALANLNISLLDNGIKK